MKKLYLLTFWDALEKDIFSLQFWAKCKHDAELWFSRSYPKHDLLLTENISEYPDFANSNFDD